MLGRLRSAWPLLLALIATVTAIDHEISPSSRLTVRSAVAEEGRERPPVPSAGGICVKATTSAGIDEYCVSSVLKPDNVNIYTYGPENLFDDALDTAWVEGVPGQGVGQWIVVAFDQIRLVKSIEINNGYNKDRDIYQKNGRVKDMRVEFSGRGKPTYVVLKDTGSTQPVPLPDDMPLKAYWIKFTIESVYPGSKFEDTAISELHITSEQAQP